MQALGKVTRARMRGVAILASVDEGAVIFEYGTTRMTFEDVLRMVPSDVLQRETFRHNVTVCSCVTVLSKCVRQTVQEFKLLLGNEKMAFAISVEDAESNDLEPDDVGGDGEFVRLDNLELGILDKVQGFRPNIVDQLIARNQAVPAGSAS